MIPTGRERRKEQEEKTADDKQQCDGKKDERTIGSPDYRGIE